MKNFRKKRKSMAGEVGFMSSSLMLIVSCLLMLLPMSILAQQNQTVEGTVTDLEGEPLPGVSVVVKNTTKGTVTNTEGAYILRNVNPNSVLQFSFVGMEAREVNVGNKTEINVSLNEDVVGIEEVVAIGYGTAKKSDLTGGVSTVSGEDIANRKATQVSQALQGATAGVMVTRSSGEPGAGASIRIRGITTIGNSEPLIIVDGIPVDNIDNINPDNIENISVLKDASSASIYGSRAASGVILITTKRAKEGEMSVNYSFEYGIETPTETPEVVNVIRYMEMNNETSWNDQGNTGNEFPIYTENEVNDYYNLNSQNPDQYPITDWEELIMKDYAPRQRHNMNMLGGTKNVKLMGAMSYETIEGLFASRTYERLNSRINSDITIREGLLNAKMDFFFTRNIQKRPYDTPNRSDLMAGPVYPARWSDGRVAGGKSGDNSYGQMKYGGFRHSWNNLVGGKFEITLQPLAGLNFSGIISPSLGFNKGKAFSKKVPYYDAEDPTQLLGYLTGKNRTGLSESRVENQKYTIQFLSKYSKDIGEHSFDLMSGYEEYKSFTEVMGASRDDYDLTSYPYLDMGPLEFRDNYGSAFENAYRSFFGRFFYSFKEKYLLQGNVRYDASSRFHPDYRWGVFPSVSAGWVLSNESFLEHSEVLSFLKLRASYGTLGNERIGNYPYQASMGFRQGVLFYQGDEIVSGTSAAQYQWAISDISWETTETYNIGIDANFFDQRLQFVGDVYKKHTRDMLLSLEIPDFIGYSNPDQNAGSMYTNGWDIEIRWKDNIGGLYYSVAANLFDSKTVMEDLSGTEFRGSLITAEGTEYREWYGYKSDGIFQTQKEIENSAVPSSSIKPGDIKYIDISGPDGEPDGVISPEYDRVPLGGSLPRYQFGANFKLEYRSFDFSMVLQGVGKENSLMNSVMVQPLRLFGFYNAPKIIEGNYWSHYNTEQANLDARYPRLSRIGNSNNYTMSDYWLFNGAYMRIKNLNLGYNLPREFTSKLSLQQVRVYVNVSDLYSFDKYPEGWDPEVGSVSYPITTTFLFGASVKF